MSITTVTAREVAELYLKKSLKTFQNTRLKLEMAGFPRPLAVPGTPIWLALEIEDWLLSRVRGELTQDEIDERKQKLAPASPPRLSTTTTTTAPRRGRPRKLARSGVKHV